MQNWITISFAAAIATAICFSGILILPPPISFVLFYLASLPLYLAGLGWGAVSALAAAAIAALIIAVLVGPFGMVFFLVSVAAAPVVLSYMASQSRQPAQAQLSTEGEIRDKDVEWYPEGRLVLWAAAISAAIVIVTVVSAGPDAATFTRTLTSMAETASKSALEELPAGQAAQFEVMMQGAIRLFPFIAPVIWLLIALANFGLSIKLIHALGRSRRPWTAFGSLQFPRKSGFVLTGAVFLSFIPGTLGYIGQILCGAFFTAFAILGLAVLHGLIAQHALRGLLLGALYFSLLLLNGLLVVPLVIVALLDMMLNMRRKISSATGSGGGG